MKSTDHKKIPVTLYQRKDFTPEFAYLYFYGGNGARAPDLFNRKFQMMLELHGLVAIIGARGGGELGAQWYKEGMVRRTQSVDDIASVNQWPIQNFPQLKGKTLASGASYGGMLTASLLARHGDKFGGFTPTTLVADLEYFKTDYYGNLAWDDLGYLRFNNGQIIDNQKSKAKLKEFSAMEQIGKNSLSVPVLMFTADNDERVSPHQTYLFTDMIQTLYPQNQQVFMIEYPGGHGVRAEVADEACFAAQIFGLNVLSPLKKTP